MRRTLVIFLDSEIEQFTGIRQPTPQVVQRQHHALEFDTLATDGLGLFRLIPQRRVLEFAQDLLQTLFFQVVVKDTP